MFFLWQVNTTALMEHADVYIDNMVCPPPPTQTRISDKVLGELIVPAPQLGKQHFITCCMYIYVHCYIDHLYVYVTDSH